MKQLPRAVRNNNPGNIDANPRNKWVGIMPVAKRNAAQLAEKRFEVFETPVYGFRAMALLLQTYQDKHNLNTIRQLIPHRYPFLLVDKIVDLDIEAKRIVGVKNVTFNEPFFQGHFPGQPIMPGPAAS